MQIQGRTAGRGRVCNGKAVDAAPARGDVRRGDVDDDADRGQEGGPDLDHRRGHGRRAGLRGVIDSYDNEEVASGKRSGIVRKPQ